ncbi:outer membrane beta-barrel protein [Cyclobacterium qasimii]|nr:outer membrane beta-barrel protein [Cyclobacterium qasimii]EPR68955.1 hypothetical protein ADICYQ_2042 [Cyclobacterium qasimii M12-11B]
MTAGIAASLLFFFFYFPKHVEIDQKVKSIADAVISEEAPFFKKEEKQQIKETIIPEIKSKAIAGAEQADKPSLSTDKSTGDRQSGLNRIPVLTIPEKDKNLTPSFVKAFTYKWDKFQADIVKHFNDFEGGTDIEKGWTSEKSIAMSQTDAQNLVDAWKSSNAEKESKQVSETPKSFKLGVMVSPQSSSNPVSGMNLGAGIMSEISLSRRLKLDVGLAYANQSMGAQNNQSMNLMMDAAPASENQKTNSNIIDTDYQLNFASLDIPVNLKYKIYDKKQTGLYLITGLSSMVYLKQNTVESYQAQSLFNANSINGALEYTPSIQSFSNVFTPETGQSNTDVAGLLNLSFGYEYQLNKEFYLSFEPFYKLPLGGLTFADQQFSIGGVNLRMNFNFKNK